MTDITYTCSCGESATFYVAPLVTDADGLTLRIPGAQENGVRYAACPLHLPVAIGHALLRGGVHQVLVRDVTETAQRARGGID